MAGTLYDDPNREVLGLEPIWTGAPDDGPEATGATAGIPGTWTPTGAGPAGSLRDVQLGRPNVIVASPATPWTSGQYVQTSVPGAAGRVTWTGSAWVGGAAPLMAGTVSAEQVSALTVEQVKEFIVANPELLAEVLELEQAGSGRVTLLSWLQTLVDEQDATP